jgi:hypothetical protein
MLPTNEVDDIYVGILYVWGLNLLVMFFIVTIPFIGLIQLVYVIPEVLRLKKQQRWGKMKGVIIGAVITALLNGSCWLSLAHAHF